MKIRDKPAGLRQRWPHWCISHALICLFSPIDACILRILSYKLVNFLNKLRSKRRVSSEHAGMKNISGEVSIFCPWTNWIHLVTCSKIEFRKPHYWIKIYRFLRYEVMWCKKVFNPAKVSWTMSDILHLDLDLKTNWLDNVSLRNNLLLIVFLQSIKCQRKIHNNYS